MWRAWTPRQPAFTVNLGLHDMTMMAEKAAHLKHRSFFYNYMSVLIADNVRHTQRHTY
jgi:hypothetical protein